MAENQMTSTGLDRSNDQAGREGVETVDARRRQLTLGIAALAALATYLDSTILFVAFPDIGASFGDASTSKLSWVLNSYTVVFAALLVPAGKLADRFGHRKAFLTGAATFTVASMACGLAPSIEFLILARALQGAGAAILVPASLALVMGAFSGEKLPQAIAIWGAVGAMSGALGPSLGALIVDSYGWRWAFFIRLPIGLLTIVAGRRFLVESRDATVRIPSLIGVALIALSAGALLYGAVESNTVGWASQQTVGFLVAGVVLLAVFIAHQRRTSAPTLDLDLFSLGNFRWGNLAMFSFSVSFVAMFFGSILFLVDVWDWSILKAGMAVAPGPALVAITAPRLGKLAAQVGQRPLILWGGVLSAVSGIYRIAFLDADVSYLVDFVPPLVLSAAAMSLVFPQLTSVAAQALPKNRVAVGGAAIQAVRQFGGSFGVALTIALLGTAVGADELLSVFGRVWWLLAGCSVITILASVPLRTGPAD